MQACLNPVKIKARRVKDKQMDKTILRSLKALDVHRGLICHNYKQPNNRCDDFEVQLCCPSIRIHHLAFFCCKTCIFCHTGLSIGDELKITCPKPGWYFNYRDNPGLNYLTANCSQYGWAVSRKKIIKRKHYRFVLGHGLRRFQPKSFVQTVFVQSPTFPSANLSSAPRCQNRKKWR